MLAADQPPASRPTTRIRSGGVSPRSYGLRVETEAIVAGLAAAVLFGLVAAVLFAGQVTPLWGGLSVGAVAALGALVGGTAAGYTGYWRSRYRPGQEWRLHIASWKFLVDSTTVALVHAIIAAILATAVFVLLQRSFEGLVLDVYSSAIAVAVSAGAAAYLIYQSVSEISTRKMSSMLVAFMAISVLTSIATAQDPAWWEYHFSQLGTAGDFSSSLFNLALIVAGFFVTTFALYLDRDLTALVERGVLEHPTAPRTISVTFVVMGLMLAGVGVFPLHVSMPLHNLCASGMAIAFSVMVLGSPHILAGLPRRFFIFCIGTFAVLIGAFLLFEPVGYYNLTAFELIAFSIIFGWISVFIRFVNALAAPGNPDVPPTV
ncbi:DUF998 domain-containing protein [Agromyces humatus]|uniref:DUF998 domain-containing protein n=1 Tax=Agromyces humatus TaxID=279573 RepID=A0ABP4WXI7_9MICO|nr:DUF998 domain-containing protein [Agromyces humatus]